MKSSDFFLIMAAIYLAPHMGPVMGFLFGLMGLTAAIYFAFRNGD